MNIKSLVLLGLILIVGCASDDNGVDSTIEDSDNPVLSENIEIYNPSLMHNNLVMAIENGGTTAYLLNKEGERLFTWIFDANLGNDIELLPNGNLLGMFKSDNSSISFGGWGGIVKIIQPDGSINWEYELNTADNISHHDAEMLPNGNVLLLVWERIDAITAQEGGTNVTFDVFTEKIIEINPITDEIVWEWRSWEHIIQDIDLTLPNYGIVSDNPQRININYNIVDNGDIMHSNGFDYDKINDVIYLSINFYNEIWVIDHSTTTQEASGISGGSYGKGGDLIYRFGNPQAYDNNEGQVLFDKNHFPNFLQQDEIGAGNLLIYVNGNSIGQSTVYELEMPQVFNLTPNIDNEPTIVWSFTDSKLFSDKISGAVRLSNGNTLICEGDFGYWEVTPSGEVAWKYNGMGLNFWRGYAYDLDDPVLQILGISF